MALNLGKLHILSHVACIPLYFEGNGEMVSIGEHPKIFFAFVDNIFEARRRLSEGVRTSAVRGVQTCEPQRWRCCRLF